MNKDLFFFFFLLVVMCHSTAGLHIVSFNAWDLPDWITQKVSLPPGKPYINLDDRMKAIGMYIVNHHDLFDVIGFQEMWREEDRLTVLSFCKLAGLDYHIYFDYGFLGSGLMTVSRYPILHTEFVKYPLDGKPQRFFQGDWYTGKGASYVQIQLPKLYNNSVLHFFNTHTHSNYQNKPHDEYIAHRIDQIMRYTDLINAQNYTDYDLVAAVGDFNAFPDSIELWLFRFRAHMYTVPLEDPQTTCSNGGHIDFINYRKSSVWKTPDNATHVFRGYSTYYQWIPALTGEITDVAPYYSDHLGVHAEFIYDGYAYHSPSKPPSFYVKYPYPEAFVVVSQAFDEISGRFYVNTFSTILISFCFFLAILLTFVFNLSPLIIVLCVIVICLNYFDFYVHFIEYTLVSDLQRNLYYEL